MPAVAALTVDRSACRGRPGAHDPVRLGAATAYKNWGCTCPDAAEAARIQNKRKRQGRSLPHRVSAVGTRRRLQALAVLGHSAAVLGELIGVSPLQVDHWRAGRRGITARNAARVAALYRTLSDTTATGPRAGWTRNHARARGWAPPIAWDDDTIDDPAATPQHLAPDTGEPSANEDIDVEALLEGNSTLNTGTRRIGVEAERYRTRLNKTAIQILRNRGVPVREIGERLKLTERSVQRYLAQLQAETPPPHSAAPSSPAPREAPAA